MKTIAQWIDTLPEPIKTRACNVSDKWNWQDEHIDLEDAVTCAFDWELTPEKETYWSFVAVEMFSKAEQHLSQLKPPAKKRIRYGVQAMEAMKQEVAIRNKAIEALEEESNLYLSEKNRLGETNAWLTEQNDALKKEVVEANRSFENSEARNKDLRNANSAYARAHDKAQAEQAQTALSLYIYKALAIVAVVANLVLGAVLIWG